MLDDFQNSPILEISSGVLRDILGKLLIPNWQLMNVTVRNLNQESLLIFKVSEKVLSKILIFQKNPHKAGISLIFQILFWQT